MRSSEFSSRSPGRLEPTTFVEHLWRSGRLETKTDSGVGFVPDARPPSVPARELVGDVLESLLRAERNLSQLEGAAHRLENPHLLVGIFKQREAILSSRIEDTFASAEELALFDYAPDSLKERDQVREVRNYVRALEHGLASDLPICLRLMREMHKILLRDTKRPGVAPGEFRQTQNAIGAGSSFSRAKFVPPPPQFVDPAMNELEQFLNNDDTELPRLVRFGLAHYQFEAIHPFLDGNGRLGRLLITLSICRHGQLTQPLIYVSGYFEQHREEYCDLLYRVSTDGVWTEWLEFYLEAVASQSKDALDRADRLVGLQTDYHRRVREKRASALLSDLVDRLFVSPSITVADAQRVLNCTPQTAGNHVRRLVQKHILVEATGRRHGRVFVAPEILDLIYE